MKKGATQEKSNKFLIAAVIAGVVLLLFLYANEQREVVYVRPTDSTQPQAQTQTHTGTEVAKQENNGLKKCNFVATAVPENLQKTLTIPPRKTTFDQSCVDIAKRLQSVKPPTEVAPAKFPPEMNDGYTLNGQIPIVYQHLVNVYNGKAAYVPLWTIESVNEMRKKAMEKQTNWGNYPGGDMATIVDMLGKWGDNILWGKDGIVVGSELPWAEAMLLEAGARHITTIEYGKISSQHPQIATVHPNLVYQQMVEGSWAQKEWAFSFSSIEHAGLGRYGDPLDPEGDFETVKLVSCLIKPGGFFFLGIPQGSDAVVFNAHRVYGRKRLAKIFEGWDLIDFYYHDGVNLDTGVGSMAGQPLILLQNQRGCAY